MTEDKDLRKRARRATDRSKFLVRRSDRLIDDSLEKVRAHAWQMIALGRICERCQLVQPNGQFEDSRCDRAS